MASEKDGYAYFTSRAKEVRALEDENWRLGFESRHRDLNLSTLSKHIVESLCNLSPLEKNDLVVDIGAGGGGLAKLLEDIYKKRECLYLMVDSEEILKLGFKSVIKPIYGSFPKNSNEVKTWLDSNGKRAKHLISNSVLHYVRYDNQLVEFIKSVIELLDEGGTAFLGDVPSTNSKKAQAYVSNKAFEESAHNFSYEDFAEIANTASNLGCSTFITPQPRIFPMSPHRVDLLIFKHKEVPTW